MSHVEFIIADNSKGAYQELSANFSAIEPPTWALLLAESCRARGATVGILDCLPTGLTPEDLASEIDARDPDFVCFVVYGQNPNASSVNMHGVIAYAQTLKMLKPQLFNLVIGPHVAALPYQSLSLHNFLDAVSINEGVYTLHDLCALYDQDVTKFHRRDFYSIRGLVYRDHAMSIRNGKRGELVHQSDIERDLPGYAWDLLPYQSKPLDLYRSHLWHSEYDPSKSSPFAAIYTSFGCIFKCSFCMINIINKQSYDESTPASELSTMRFLPLSIIKKSLDYFADNDIYNVRICDEMFFLNPEHYTPILDYIIDKGYKFNMWAYARVDTIKSSQLSRFKSAGVNWLGVGIESGSELVRNRSVKGAFSLDKIRGVINRTRDSGISVGSNFILGLPDDDLNSCNVTADLAIELSTEYINIYPCIDLPGSSLYLNSEPHSIGTYLRYGFLSYHTIPNSTKSMTPAEVLQTRDELWRKVYSSPSVLATVSARFGSVAVETIENLKLVKLKRFLLGDKLD